MRLSRIIVALSLVGMMGIFTDSAYAGLADPIPTATATPGFTPFPALTSCKQVTKKVGVKVSGRFGWKPLAAHFNAAVIVAPRLYSLPHDPFGPPTVNIYLPSGKLLFIARLKSIGLCNGVGEDFCANTYITPIGHPGVRIERKSGSIIVVIKPKRGSTKGCRWYYVPHPEDRVQYENK